MRDVLLVFCDGSEGEEAAEGNVRTYSVSAQKCVCVVNCALASILFLISIVLR